MHHIDNFYTTKQEPNRSCLLSLRHIILHQDHEVSETTKYGMPCFCFKKKMFCYLWVDKKTDQPYILFVEGDYLHHDRLESGSRKRMKILKFDAEKDLPLELIEELLKKALNLYKQGVIKIK